MGFDGARVQALRVVSKDCLRTSKRLDQVHFSCAGCVPDSQKMNAVIRPLPLVFFEIAIAVTD